MADIKLKSITKSFGATTVLTGIDLDIVNGEFLTLVGPSGCGKSTLLRIIAGLEMQSSGDVEIDGTEVNRVRASKRDLAMVFQSYALYPHLTVRKNMITPLMLRDLSFWQRFPVVGHLMPGRKSKANRIDATVDETAATLQIEHLMHRKPGQLSGGQRQRVALGRAMVRKPVAFLMDEPLSNLDAALRVHMRAELAELHRSLSTTFVYVTHDQAEALTMSDRMAVMMDGQILQLGAPDEVYHNPIDLRVAEFVGSPKINLLPGQVDGTGRVSVLGTSLRRRISETNTSVTIGVRPEHLQIVTSRSENDVWPFRVTHKENMGADFYLHGEFNGSGYRGIARARPDDVADISLGQEILLKEKPSAAMAFAESGPRIQFVEGS